jgi:hypothetical protein
LAITACEKLAFGAGAFGDMRQRFITTVPFDADGGLRRLDVHA